ncbi:hypothetical protein [Natronobeatus ordinarius]|uniref:hypothetical protein n=1 Tax=Natronobeatus ordinarius TaxID=2963433 RepID=UPI0020CBE86B|nr:hypothetical protein [Natronobeatus ordinarius]
MGNNPTQTNRPGVSRRRVLQSVATTSTVGASALSGVARADDENICEKYKSANSFNNAIDEEEEFINALLEFIDGKCDEFDRYVDTVSKPDEFGEGEIITKRKSGEETVPQLNLIRKTASGPLNIVLYPDSDDDPFATRTVEKEDELERFTISKEADSGVEIEKSTKHLPEESSPDIGYDCPITCPTDDECCECVEECVSCCNESCTPVYTYGCNCCQYTNPSCWGDCY